MPSTVKLFVADVKRRFTNKVCILCDQPALCCTDERGAGGDGWGWREEKCSKMACDRDFLLNQCVSIVNAGRNTCLFHYQ